MALGLLSLGVRVRILPEVPYNRKTHMTDEDRTAAKLKGYNCLIKFKDGEEIYLDVDNLSDDSDDNTEWFETVEKFINNGLSENTYLPLAGISIAADTVKYVRKI
jgi:hypothetical protein